jgi:hypothetical protein
MILNLKEQQTTLRFAFESYCHRLEQFLVENQKFAIKCVKRVEMISGEIVSQEEVEEEEAEEADAQENDNNTE